MISDKIEKIKEIANLQIDNDLLLRILFEMNRFFDKSLTLEIQEKQRQIKRVFNQKERNLLRKYYYYNMPEALAELSVDGFASIVYDDAAANSIIDECLKRCALYGSEKIVASICERKKNYEQHNIVDNSEQWLSYYSKKVAQKFDYSVFVLNINQADFALHSYDINYYCNLIAQIYDKLENYRHLILKIEGDIKDKLGVIITWQVAYKLSIYCENFVLYKDKFFPFKRDISVSKLTSFLNERFDNSDIGKTVEKFYSGISTGFKFEDCYVAEEQKNIILTFKKIVLDKSAIPCPSCMTTIQSGNSFPEMFLRSYECKNPNCPDRSKSGRGKRFDEFGVYRYFKLVEDYETNRIAYNLYNSWRRDLFSNDNDILEMITKYYAWNDETIVLYNSADEGLLTDRKLVPFSSLTPAGENDYIKTFDDLPIVIFFKEVCAMLDRKTGCDTLHNGIEVINGNSSVELRKLKKGQVGAAITSPPYYNAREYSQWSTLIMYLVDMMINGAAVCDALVDDGFYLYNIGDIVNSDNIYVESNMSKRRLLLGFLSCMVFEIVGFNVAGNIIWDKGQVQSKRNSTVNLNSGYVKCINCYEHVFVLKNGQLDADSNYGCIKAFSPVIKINSKGENTYKHTAPYPPEMVDLLTPFIIEGKYVLDPFLGSGTTVKWCKEHNIKGLGYELNKEYFELCKKRIYNK